MDDYDRIQKDEHYLEKHYNNKISLDDFLLVLNTGDLIFSRSASTAGKIIQFSGHCAWNHVAMCVVLKENGKDVKYWCEATNRKDTPSDNEGVKMWSMESKLRAMLLDDTTFFTFGVASIKKKEDANCSNNNNNNGLSKEECDKLINFYKREKGKPYKYSYKVLFFSWFDGFSSLKTTLCCYSQYERREENDTQPLWTINEQDTSRYFCSELMVEALVETKMMNRKMINTGNDKYVEMPSSEWTVADLADITYVNNNLDNNFYYTEIVLYFVYNK